MKREYVVKEDRPGVSRGYVALEGKGEKVERKLLRENTGAEKAKLFPTDVGVLVNQFLMANFPDILDYNFTAEVEKRFDEVAQGLEKWTAMIADFYTPFHRQVQETAKNSEKVSGERLLGNDPASGEPIYVKLSRFGPVAQKGETKGEQKPVFAGLKKGQTLESVTLEEALELFKLPRRVGLFEDEEMVAAVGRFGPYIRHKGAFYSIPKGDDPITLTQERAVEIIEQKRQADANRVIKTFEVEPLIQVLNGRFGPYIACDKKNYKIDKKTDAASLTLEDCRAIIAAGDAAAPGAKRRAGARMAAAKAKTTASKAASKTAAKSASAKSGTAKTAKTAAGKTSK